MSERDQDRARELLASPFTSWRDVWAILDFLADDESTGAADGLA